MAIPNWLSLSTTAGTGNATVTVSASSYSELLTRAASLTVSTRTRSAIVNVIQELDDTFNISPSAVTYPSSGASYSITVNSSNPWTASTSASWITLSTSSASGSTTITVTASSAVSTTERTAVVTFVDSNGLERTLTATQTALSGIIVEYDFVNLYGGSNWYQTGRTPYTAYTSAWTAEYPEWLEVSPSSGESGSGRIDVWVNDRFESATTISFKDENGVVSDTLGVICEEPYVRITQPNVLEWNESAFTIVIESNTEVLVDVTSLYDSVIAIDYEGYFMGNKTIHGHFLNSQNTGYSIQDAVVSVNDNTDVHIIRKPRVLPTPDAYTIYYLYTPNGSAETWSWFPASSAWNNTILSNTVENDMGVLRFQYPIKTVADDAFTNTGVLTGDIKQVRLPEGVETIGKFAFWGLAAYINIPNSVRIIGNGGARGNYIEWNSSSSSLEYVGLNGMSHTTLLNTVVEFPASLYRLDGCAFQSSNVTKVIFNQYNWFVGGAAFHDCKKLTEIVMKQPYAPMMSYAYLDGENIYTFTGIANKGVLHAPVGSDYSAIYNTGSGVTDGGLPSGWTITYDQTYTNFPDNIMHPSSSAVTIEAGSGSSIVSPSPQVNFFSRNKDANCVKSEDSWLRESVVDTYGGAYVYGWVNMMIEVNGTGSQRTGTYTMYNRTQPRPFEYEYTEVVPTTTITITQNA